jgi:hypothetical protein
MVIMSRCCDTEVEQVRLISGGGFEGGGEVGQLPVALALMRRNWVRARVRAASMPAAAHRSPPQRHGPVAGNPSRWMRGRARSLELRIRWGCDLRVCVGT